MRQLLTISEILKLGPLLESLNASSSVCDGGFHINLYSDSFDIWVSAHRDRSHPKVYKSMNAVYKEMARLGFDSFTAFVISDSVDLDDAE